MTARPTAAAVRQRDVQALGPWFHNIHLPDGTQTAPNHFYGDFPSYKWLRLAAHLPRRMRGWRALDIGCNAGFYSFELARRGAQVTGVDVDPRYLAQARWAARQLGLEHAVEFRRLHVYQLGRLDETFDLVLFMGVFYHLRHPLLALDLAAEKVRRLMVFQTLTMPGREVVTKTYDRGLNERADLRRPGWPKMAFIEHRLASDPTNWWVPNHAGVEAMLRSSGLRVTAYPDDETYLCKPARPPRSQMRRNSRAWVRSVRDAEMRAAAGRSASRNGSSPGHGRQGRA